VGFLTVVTLAYIRRSPARADKEPSEKEVAMRRIPLVASLALFLAGSVAAALAAEPIKVGISIAQSPPGSVVQGTQVKDGLEIVKDMVNAKGGVLGRKIELVYEDNQGIPEKGRAASEKLITSDHVVAITGGHQSSVCLAEIEVAHRYHVPYVNTNCWSDDIRLKGYPEVFNPGNYNSRVSMAMAETIAAMKLKSVVAFAENTDYGIGQAKLLDKFIKEKSPGTKYRYETLDRASKDFTPAVLALRANPPEMVVNIMLPPAAYILMNQLYEQGVAPSPKTWSYDGAGLADYPDFWQNVKEAGKDMICFALYHPKMKAPPLGKEVAEEYTKRTKNEPNRLIFQAADSLLLIVDAIKQAKSTDPKAIEKALRTMKFSGTRGTFSFNEKKGNTYQQWVEIPYVNYQLTAVNQPISQSNIIQGPGQPLDVNKLPRPN
jgi:ABC-type branched-subunit amino acid transport system substrate-binding protein